MKRYISLPIVGICGLGLLGSQGWVFAQAAPEESEPMDVNLSGADVDVQVVGGDTLIITATDQDLELLQELINRLDTTRGTKAYRVLKLKNKNAQQVAQAVQKTMQDMLPVTDPRPSELVTLNPVASNLLLATGPESKLDMVEDIVKALDVELPGIPDFEMMTFKLKHIKAADAAAQLDDFIKVLKAQQAGGGAGGGGAQDIKVLPISINNTIVVVGPVEEKEKIQQLIDQIDVEPTAGFGALKLAYFPLVNNKASDLARVLNELFATASEGDKAAKEAIRRLSMLRSGPDGTTVELPEINLERQIKVIAEENSQALIVATSQENVDPLRQLIRLLDSVPVAVEQGLRIFPLKYADATTVKDLLADMFKQGKDLPKPAPGTESSKAVPENPIGESLVYNVGVTADARSNVLIVTGRPEQMVLVDGIIQKIDVPSVDIRQPLRLITLHNTDATQLAKLIEDLWTKREDALKAQKAGDAAVAREKVFVSVDLRTNSLIINGAPDNFEEIVRMVNTLETAPERADNEIRLIPCKSASAGDLKTKIDELWKRKGELRDKAELPTSLPVVVADQRSNTLVVSANNEDFEDISRLVAALGDQPLAPMAQIRMIPLKNNDVGQIADMLKTLFEERMKQRLSESEKENPTDRVAFASEQSTNTLLVASSPDNFAEIQRIVAALDVQADLEGVVKVFLLQNAQAETVSDMIADLFEKGLYTGVPVGENPINQERQKVAVVADPRSNAIIASASKANLSIIESLIAKMDTGDVPVPGSDMKLFRLTHADPVKISSMLDKLFEGMAGGNETFKAPTIVPDQLSGTLIVTGSRDALKRVADLVQALDVRSEGAGRLMQVYTLRYASAVKLAARVQELFERRNEGGDATERAPFYVMADEPTNTLVVAASDEDHSMVKHLLELLDVPSTISRQVEVFPLQNAKAEATAESLEQLFQSQASSGGGGGSAGRADAIAVQPDKRSNSLIVWAAASDMDNVARIIAKLDTARIGQEMMVKVVTLKRALAEDLKERLVNTLNGGQQGATGADQQAVILSYEETMPDGTKAIRKLVRQDVTIEADARTNSLFVMAPAGSMEMLEGFIQSIDRIPPIVAEIRMFPLANADAEEIVTLLEEIFEEKAQGGGSGEGPETTLKVEGAVTTPGSDAAAVPGQTLKFTANRRTNIVVAAGTTTDLDMVEQLVHNLDVADTEERERYVYLAKYIPAQDVASAVKDFVDQEKELYGDLDDETSVQRRIERAVTVVGDEKSNSVLLGFSPRNQSRTLDMVNQIDRPPPQVMIQVLIAEVALDDRLEFGMEWALQDLLFSDTAVVGPNGVVRGNNFDFVGGTDVGAAGAAGSFGGFSFAITGEDFSYLIRALQSDGSLEVLSRPTIMVENNEEANITIGDNVPFLRGSQVTDTGQVNSQVEYEEVGIILDVTPHINPDGYVNLEIKPEISALNQGSNVQISEGLTAPTFTKRSAETVVTVKDGETVVIGGLIQTQEDERETKVPILGDIPGLGNMFRATQHTNRRTELLMVLTVDVLWDEHDAFAASAKLRDQSGFMPEDVKRSPLMEGLRITPGDETSPLDEAVPTRVRRIKSDPDSPVYGPKPDTYGPKRPAAKPKAPASESPSAKDTYGPALPSKDVASTGGMEPMQMTAPMVAPAPLATPAPAPFAPVPLPPKPAPTPMPAMLPMKSVANGQPAKPADPKIERKTEPAKDDNAPVALEMKPVYESQ
jgi:type II secretion system protein D